MFGLFIGAYIGLLFCIDAQVANGNENSKQVPWLRVLRTLMGLLCSSKIRFTIAKPSPVELCASLLLSGLV